MKDNSVVVANIGDYLMREKVVYSRIPSECIELQRVKEYIHEENEKKRLALGCMNLPNGQECFIRFMTSFTGVQKDEAFALYNSIESSSDSDMIKNYEAIGRDIRITDFVNRREARGFIEKENKKGYEFNANKFVRHFISRVKIVALKSSKLAIYNKKGRFELLDEYLLGKIIRHVIHECLLDAWKSIFEKEIIKAIEREVPLIEELNTYREYINVLNGMLNIKTQELEPHNPNYLSSIQIPIEYNPDAKCDRFIRFIEEITLGDKQLIAVIQEIIGYCLTAETRAEKAFYFYGSGSNGKSVLSKIIKELVGAENVTGVTLEKMGQPFGLQSIINKTVSIAAENELVGSKINTENLKALISGDLLSVAIKYKDTLDYIPTCKLIFLVNTLPNTSDTTHGYFRKIMVIPFKRRFSDSEKDVNLFDKLKANEMPGILNWALEGLKRLQNNNYKFTESDEINNLMKEYEEEQNPVLKFVEEAITTDVNEKLSKKEILVAYSKWLSQQSIDDKNSKSSQIFWKLFNIAIETKGINVIQKKIKGYPYLGNIKFNSDFKQEISASTSYDFLL